MQLAENGININLYCRAVHRKGGGGGGGGGGKGGTPPPPPPPPPRDSDIMTPCLMHQGVKLI